MGCRQLPQAPRRPRRGRETPYNPHPIPYTRHTTPNTLHTPHYTQHTTPNRIHPTPYFRHQHPATRTSEASARERVGALSPFGSLQSPLRARPTETKVESGTSQSKSGTSVNLSDSGEPCRHRRGRGWEPRGGLAWEA